MRHMPQKRPRDSLRPRRPQLKDPYYKRAGRHDAEVKRFHEAGFRGHQVTGVLCANWQEETKVLSGIDGNGPLEISGL